MPCPRISGLKRVIGTILWVGLLTALVAVSLTSCNDDARSGTLTPPPQAPTPESQPTPTLSPTATITPTPSPTATITPTPSPTATPFQKIQSALPWARDGITGLDKATLSGLSRLLEYKPSQFARLAERPWFADGLDPEETALVKVLIDKVDAEVEFDNLIQNGCVNSRTTTLPLAGEVDLFVVR